MYDHDEITLEQGVRLDRVDSKIMDRLISTIKELAYDDLYEVAADWMGTNDPDVEELHTILTEIGIL